MADEGPTVWGTIREIHGDVKNLDGKVDALTVNVALLLEQRERDREKMDKLEASNTWLQRAVYMIGAPLVLILSGYEAVVRWLA